MKRVVYKFKRIRWKFDLNKAQQNILNLSDKNLSYHLT